jgi:hypothetical protein
MCATAAKSAAKPNAKAKKTSPARAEASRRNGRKSMGPTTDEGKARSRWNALKHGMTAQTVLLPGDDSEAFLGRLRYLQDDLQARNSLEAVVIERLAGDLWKSDRADKSAGARISFRLRHDPVDQSRRDADEAIELGQYLLWQPAWPLPVGLPEGEAKGAVAKFPLADVPGDPHHPARLLLKLQATVAGCDWLLKQWGDLRFRLQIPGTWVMSDVWTMVRLMGKTALEVKHDFQVALLVLASLALEPAPEPATGREPTVAETASAMTRNDGVSRVVAGITRLCEPFQQALARMPLDRLAPDNEDEARQRLMAVVDQELDRIDRFRDRLQKIADADEAEAPVRLAFETGIEGDRARRYVLSYERLVNRRIDTFLKVRKASSSGELDLIELERGLGTQQFAELTAASGIRISQATGNLRSGERRCPETRAQQWETHTQHSEAAVRGESPTSTAPAELARIDQVEANSIVATETDEAATRSDNGSRGGGACLPRGDDDDLADRCHEPPCAISATIAAAFPAESPCGQMSCGGDTILRNEPTAAPEDPRNVESESPTGLAASVENEGKVERDEPRPECGPNEFSVPIAKANCGSRGDLPEVLAADVPVPAIAPSVGAPAPVQAPRLTLTPQQLLHNQRVAMYRAMKGLDP